MITEERLKAMEERCAAAMAGPWTIDDPEEHPSSNIITWGLRNKKGVFIGDYIPEKNIKFIAHARTDLPDLITAYRALQAENTRLREELSRTRFELCRARDGARGTA